MYTMFRCPHCKALIRFSPPPGVREQIAEGIKDGKPVAFGIKCHHCPTVVVVNPETGDAVEGKAELVSRMDVGTIAFADSALITGPGIYAENEEKVEDLIFEGCELMATNVGLAEKKFRDALRHRNNEPKAWYNIGVCRCERQDFMGAMECFRTALSFDRSLLDAWNNLGICLLKCGQVDEADKCYSDALDVDSEYARFYLGKANVANMRGDHRKGRRWLEKALEKDPSYGPAREALRGLDAIENR